MRNTGRWALAAGAGGLLVAAIVLAVHALVNRRPDRWIGGGFERGTQYLALSLGFGIAVAVVAIGLGVALLLGRDVGGWCGWMLAGATSVAAWVYLSGTADSARAALGGPGSRPMVELSQFTWILYAFAFLLLTAASVLEGSGTGRRWVAAPAAAVGLVVALLAGTGIVSAVTSEQVKVTIADAIPIPDLPTQVGEHVAYSLVAPSADALVPAGPGFVTPVGDELVAFDGATGMARWRLPHDLMPWGCSNDVLSSTGTEVDSVVVLDCRGGLVGIEAMTGEVLWTNASDWSPAGPLLAPGTTVAVVQADGDTGSIGSLDPRSGKVRWSRAVQCSPDRVAATDVAIVYADQCAAETGDLVRIFDARSGVERRFVLPLPAAVSGGGDVDARIAAVYKNSVLLYVRSQNDLGDTTDTLVLVDTQTGAARELPGEVHNPVKRDSRQYPGALIEVTNDSDPDSVDVVVMSDGRRRHIAGVGMFLWPDEFETGLRWEQVGDTMVTAEAYEENNRTITMVAEDGTVSRRPSPCGDDMGGVMSVPGALLVLCARYEGHTVQDAVDVVALR